MHAKLMKLHTRLASLLGEANRPSFFGAPSHVFSSWAHWIFAGAALTNVCFWHLAELDANPEACPLLRGKRTSPIRSPMSAFDPKRTWNPRLIWRKAAGSKAAYGLFWGWLVQSSPSPPTPAVLAETKIAPTGVALFRDAPACPKEDVMNSMRRMFLIVSLLLPVTVLASGVASAETKLAATIFSYDGTDFVRTQTTLTQDGQSAVNTKLDHDSAAYKALSQKQSYTGPATLFGQDYEANYAPLVGADGKLTGALFVAVPK